MAAPSLFDGISRAIEELGIPSVGLLLLIGIIRVGYGSQEAGIAYIVLTVAILLGTYTSAKYWNVQYTLGFVAVGFILWFGVPGAIPQLVPSLFSELGTFVGLVFLIAMAMMLTDKR